MLEVRVLKARPQSRANFSRRKFSRRSFDGKRVEFKMRWRPTKHLQWMAVSADFERER